MAFEKESVEISRLQEILDRIELPVSSKPRGASSLIPS